MASGALVVNAAGQLIVNASGQARTRGDSTNKANCCCTCDTGKRCYIRYQVTYACTGTNTAYGGTSVRTLPACNDESSPPADLLHWTVAPDNCLTYTKSCSGQCCDGIDPDFCNGLSCEPLSDLTGLPTRPPCIGGCDTWPVCATTITVTISGIGACEDGSYTLTRDVCQYSDPTNCVFLTPNLTTGYWELIVNGCIGPSNGLDCHGGPEPFCQWKVFTGASHCDQTAPPPSSFTGTLVVTDEITPGDCHNGTASWSCA